MGSPLRASTKGDTNDNRNMTYPRKTDVHISVFLWPNENANYFSIFFVHFIGDFYTKISFSNENKI